MQQIADHTSQSDLSVLSPPLIETKASAQSGFVSQWGKLYGLALPLVLANYSRQTNKPVLVITDTATAADRLEHEIKFFLGETLPILRFPDWETLPYDVFSPHQDIISERLTFLYELPTLKSGVLIIPVTTLAQQLPPQRFIESHSLIFNVGDTLSIDHLRQRFETSGYQCVSSVLEHGEFAVRGNIMDVFPMGSDIPYRIEFFDDEVENIRVFDIETQRTIHKVDTVKLLPAREFPLDDDAVTLFRQNYRANFEGKATDSIIYKEISDKNSPPGIEYYLPLFFDTTNTLFDYLPPQSSVIEVGNIEAAIDTFQDEVNERYESRRHNIERPLLAPGQLFIKKNTIFQSLKNYFRIRAQHFELEKRNEHAFNFSSKTPPLLTIDPHHERPTHQLLKFTQAFEGRTLFVAESSGRKEALMELLRGCDIHPSQVESWEDFQVTEDKFSITVYPLEQGLQISTPELCIISETQLFGQQVLQRRRRNKSQRDSDAIIRNLAELSTGVPVVHDEYGVGRYQGLITLNLNNIDTEFLLLKYKDDDKLYIPVNSLHLISRYTGGALESAPLHKLGSGQWEKAKRKAAEQVRDVAAELLELYAKREAKKGYAYNIDELQYRLFASSFPFEETPDQQNAIDSVISNMRNIKPMDQLVCGDVGFGKTEVAMRAAFIAVQDSKQVAILCPTTLLTQQHLENFKDRFSDWPVQIGSLSRFQNKKEQQAVLDKLSSGQIDIVIGTHKLIQNDVKFKRLGLVVIDEEHRFGVRQKEQFKKLRAEVDILTLTATPIPRTLNMAMSGIRGLSIIATPPAKRLAIKTFVNEWDDALLQEACIREIKRGGQVYFVHNDVASIAKQTKKIQDLVPEAKVQFAHGQMRERELEQVMSDFYHQRFNILVCTTIIETGIDIPSANTILINRADNFGLAQLYQLRGRVGRSHHRAYCYLIIPARRTLTSDAKKRLEAIESIDSLGTGFTLATHDLEIRGAGELLGEGQSGQIVEIGYTMYTELLERAVNALKSGKTLALDEPLHLNTEVELHMPALIPESYLYDVHERLILYKRIANAGNENDLKELQVEMIDRFGLLPDATKNLFSVTHVKLHATQLGIKKLDFGENGGKIHFTEKPNIDQGMIINLIQNKYVEFKLDGNEKLKLLKKIPQPEKRIEYINKLLTSFH